MALKRLSPDCKIVPVKLDGLAILVVARHPAHYAVAGYPASSFHGHFDDRLFGSLRFKRLCHLAVLADYPDGLRSIFAGVLLALPADDGTDLCQFRLLELCFAMGVIC